MDVVLADREIDVMEVLWERGSATVAEVREQLPDELAYTTVLTVLRTLAEKGYVGYEEEGRAHRYHPLLERDLARSGALRKVMRKMFRGSPELLLTHLVTKRDVPEDAIRRMRELLDTHLQEEE
ncbi:BlaI/MecI/CopY family transcriptional regulator [soil metagenome]|jgi:predicted transcriptional regulator|nr:BlaI/MecI/CopY family transcriptional regulator [Gemmatimonadota bacterium]